MAMAFHFGQAVQAFVEVLAQVAQALLGHFNGVFELVDGRVGFRLADFEEAVENVHGYWGLRV
jgi:hypothetical protein